MLNRAFQAAAAADTESPLFIDVVGDESLIVFRSNPNDFAQLSNLRQLKAVVVDDTGGATGDDDPFGQGPRSSADQHTATSSIAKSR